MNNFSKIQIHYNPILILLLCLISSSFAASPYNGQVKRVVLFDYNVNNDHIPSRKAIRDAFVRLQALYGFQLVMLGQTQQAQLNDSILQNTQVLVFSDGMGDPLPAGPQRLTVENFVQKQGNGLLLLHAADVALSWQFLKDASVQLFLSHPPDGTQGTLYLDTAGLNNPETRNILRGLPNRITMQDEWYSFPASARVTPGVTILLSADETTFTPLNPMKDHTMAWSHHMGSGLVAYEALGHRDVWTLANTPNPKGGPMQDLLWNMTRYLARDFAGCMDQNYLEFNADATVTKINTTDPNPCKTKVATGIRSASHRNIRSVFKSNQKASQWTIPEKGEQKTKLRNVQGKILN